MKRIFSGSSYANVTATLALVVALGGTSYAAIKLPRNSVSSLQVKDHSLLRKDFRIGQLPAGRPGPAGPPGTSGASGGPAVAARSEGADALIPGSAPQTIQSINLPAGSWVVSAHFIANNSGNTDGFLACSLNVGATAVDTLGSGNGTDFGTGDSANTLAGAGTLAAPGTAAVVCTTNNTVGAGTYRAKSIVAISATGVS